MSIFHRPVNNNNRTRKLYAVMYIALTLGPVCRRILSNLKLMTRRPACGEWAS